MENQIQFYKNKLAYEMDAADLYQALKNKEEVIVLDTRQVFGYEKEHIPNSVSLPHKEISVKSTKHLDKSKLYVCYCDGIGCNASTKGALKMVKLGFNTKELLGGIEWWKFDGYPTEGKEPTKGGVVTCAC